MTLLGERGGYRSRLGGRRCDADDGCDGDSPGRRCIKRRRLAIFN